MSFPLRDLALAEWVTLIFPLCLKALTTLYVDFLFMSHKHTLGSR